MALPGPPFLLELADSARLVANILTRPSSDLAHGRVYLWAEKGLSGAIPGIREEPIRCLPND